MISCPPRTQPRSEMPTAKHQLLRWMLLKDIFNALQEGRRVQIVPAEGSVLTTRWTTTLSPKVNLSHAINFRALQGAKLVKQPSKFEATKPSKSTVWKVIGR